ncbi:MAG TPA: VOC family protein [Sphingomonadales bacterium]|nr:VOC family protein [Sphingomonadales bacterium]
MIDAFAYDHFGIRVSSFKRAAAFYKRLGFRLAIDHGDNRAYEVVNKYGIRINLIANGVRRKDANNILMDEPVKYPGYTHAAFIVPDLQKAVAFVRKAKIKITEGPKEVERRRYFFIRDPDGNVLEFNELR